MFLSLFFGDLKGLVIFGDLRLLKNPIFDSDSFADYIGYAEIDPTTSNV
jgi:hypothetical protein